MDEIERKNGPETGPLHAEQDVCVFNVSSQ
jgi:hypothetical protein